MTDKDFDYFKELDKCIASLASQGDLLMYNAIPKKEYDELYETILILQVFHTSFFGQTSSIFTHFLEETQQLKNSKEDRKQTGSFYTPSYVAEYICKETLRPLILGVLRDESVEDKVKSITELKICDPAMGSGIFIKCAQDYMMRWLCKLKQNKYNTGQLAELSLSSLYGVDINPEAVKLTKLVLNLNTAKWKVKNEILEFTNHLANHI